jgi:RNase P subunit RPR2
MSNCTECGGILLPLNGHNVNIEENKRIKTTVYCNDCGSIFCVIRKNMRTDLKGNVEDYD